jgi:glycosyltransferase involved in cell wall biosynthesis
VSIRVAFDISTLAEHFGGFHAKTGIYRTVETLLRELENRPDVEVSPTSLCGANPVLHAALSRLYLRQRTGGGSHKLTPSYRSRVGISALGELLYHEYYSEAFQALPRFSARSIAVRGPLKIVPHLYWRDINQVFDSGSVDVFHSPFPQLPKRVLTGETPRVLTIYDLIPVLAQEFVHPEHPRVFQQLLDSVDIERDWITAISEFTKSEFCEYTGMSPERVVVTPLAAADHFQPVTDAERLAEARRRYGIPPSDYFLSITTLEPRKNLDHLIRSFFALQEAEPAHEAALVLVGAKGLKHDKIIAEATREAYRARIVFTGYVADEDLSAIYSGATGFVYPSLYEGFGLPPLEAMQCGTPVITSSTTSLPEVVGDAGILVDPRDGDALSQAMLTLLRDAELSRSLRTKGLARAADFSWSACAARTVDVYRRAVHER